MVLWDGSSYTAVFENIGISPENNPVTGSNLFWLIIASKGDQGLSGAPSGFSRKTVSGIMPSTASGFLVLDIGITNTNTILLMDVLVDYSVGALGRWIPSSQKSTYQFYWFLNSGGQLRIELTSSSQSLYNKPFMATIFYDS